MKKLLLIIPGIVLFVLVSCKPSVKEALSYNDTIVYYHREMDKSLSILSDTYNNYVAAEMDSAYQTAKLSAQAGIEFIKSIDDFHGDESYKAKASELFELYKSVIENEHARMISLLKLPTEKFQQAEIDELDSLKKSASNKIQLKIDEVAETQKKFAEKFNYKFETEEK